MTIPTCPHARRDKTRLTAQLQTLPHITANASNPMLGKFIRALLRPISRFALNTGSGAPYCYAIRDAGSGYVLTTLRAYAYAIALSRALRSIRALGRPIAAQYGTPAPAMCSLRCAHTPTLSPYLALCAQYGLFVIPGVRSAYPGLYSGALSGRSIPPSPYLPHLPQADVHSPSPYLSLLP